MSRRYVWMAAVPALLPVCLAAGLVVWWAPAAIPVLLQDGVLVGLVLAAATGWGAKPAEWVLGGSRGFGDVRGGCRPWQRLCTALAIGCGILATLTLVMGVVGVLHRVTAVIVVAVGVALLALHRRSSTRGVDLDRSRRSGTAGPDAQHKASMPLNAAPLPGLLWRTLVLAPLGVPLAVGLFGATLPPGVLWSEEGGAYDVLEYHLQAPREYFDAGRIHFLPHNVYASFPQLVEMHYLLLMHLAGGPLAAATAAQLLHATFGVLIVLATGAWLPRGAARDAGVLLAGGVPWIAYLGCLAYVELPVLFFSLVAAGLALESAGFLPDREASPRLAFLAGCAAGLAGGSKYTALVLSAVGLGVAAATFSPLPVRARVRWLGLYGLGVVLSFSPWLIRNTAFAGNPIYPFAYSWFGGMAWSAEQAEQWARGHDVPAAFDSIAGRASLVARELFLSPKYGAALWAVGLLALIRSRSRKALAMLVWGAIIVLVWSATTQMAGRLALPVLVPTILLGGLAPADPSDRGRATTPGRLRHVWTWMVLGLCCCGSILNGAHLLRLLGMTGRLWQEHRVGLSELPGAVADMAAAQTLNRALGAETAARRSLGVPGPIKAWLVGEARVFYLQFPTHYSVVFSRDPWLTFAREAPPAAAVEWLRTRGVTHLVFSWAEIERLRRTYGFPDWVTPAGVDRLVSAAAGGLRRLSPGRAELGPAASAEWQAALRSASIDIYEVVE